MVVVWEEAMQANKNGVTLTEPKDLDRSKGFVNGQTAVYLGTYSVMRANKRTDRMFRSTLLHLQIVEVKVVGSGILGGFSTVLRYVCTI